VQSTNLYLLLEFLAFSHFIYYLGALNHQYKHRWNWSYWWRLCVQANSSLYDVQTHNMGSHIRVLLWRVGECAAACTIARLLHCEEIGLWKWSRCLWHRLRFICMHAFLATKAKKFLKISEKKGARRQKETFTPLCTFVLRHARAHKRLFIRISLFSRRSSMFSFPLPQQNQTLMAHV
jgi:hypothetical protein